MNVLVSLATLLLAFPNLPSQTIVLTYHDIISRRDSKALWFDCTGPELESQLRWMQSKGTHFITLDQLYRHLAQGKALPSRPVAITFADNYLGFWQRGYPVLKRMRIPCAMFVHTGYVGDRAHGRPKMDWAQLRALDKEGLVTIGSQTISHPADLGTLPDEAIRNELQKSKATLEAQLGHAIPYLAYPNGKFDTRCETEARAAGYKMAFSEETHPVERSASIYSVNRYVHTKYRKAFADVGAKSSPSR